MVESINSVAKVVAYIFGAGLIANAILFISQAWRIFKTKSSKGVSLLTFGGFCVLQLTGILHGYFQDDPYLMYGMLASFLTCGTVTILAVIYKERVHT